MFRSKAVDLHMVNHHYLLPARLPFLGLTATLKCLSWIMRHIRSKFGVASSYLSEFS